MHSVAIGCAGCFKCGRMKNASEPHAARHKASAANVGVRIITRSRVCREAVLCSPRVTQSDDVDDVIVRLKSLVDWNRRRLAKEIEEGRAMVVPKRTPASSPGYVAIS